MYAHQNIAFLAVKGLMGIGRPLLLLGKYIPEQIPLSSGCTKILSAVTLERVCCTFMLGLIAVLNSYRPTDVASRCTK
jgi:hypothetical protein